jgi:hypothetical protein
MKDYMQELTIVMLFMPFVQLVLVWYILYQVGNVLRELARWIRRRQ